MGGSWPTSGGREGSHCLQVSLACHILGASDERVGLENTVYLAGLSSKLDPVGSTVRYEMMKLCTGSV